MRRPLVWIAVALICGAAFASAFDPPFRPLLAVLVLSWALTIALLLFKRTAAAAAAVTLTTFFLGTCTYTLKAYVVELPDQLARDHATLAPATATLTGIVTESFQSPEGERLTFVLEATHIQMARMKTGGAPATGRTRVLWYEPAALIQAGDVVRVSGTLKLLRGFKNPGTFDYERYMHRRRIFTTMYARDADSVVVTGREKLEWPRRIREHFRRRGLQIISSAMVTRESTAFISAILLGDRSLLTDEIQGWFRETGTFHILAISGLHVGLVYLIISLVFVPLPIGPRTRVALCIIVVWMYALATGGSVSVTRAAIMLTLVLTGYYIGREGDFLTSVAVAALLLVGFNPLVVDELGFQLSFTAVVLLCTFEPIFSERFYPFISDKLHWIPAPILHRFSITVFASVVIGIGMLPVVAYHFNIISLVFPIANLIVVPLLSCVLASAFAMLLAGMIWLKAAVVFGLVTEAFAWIIFATVKVCSLVPGGSMRIPSPPLWMLGLEATAILLMWWQSRPSRRVAAFMAAALLVVAASYAAATLDAPTLRATFLDVGDSDSCLVEFPAGETMLVDTGFATRYLDCGEHLIAPLLWNKGLTTVDVLLLTHPDADHTGGAAFLIENFEVGRILLPVLTDAGRFSPVLHVAAENECAVARTASGDELPGFRDVRIEVLNPPSNRPYEYLSDNDTSVVIRITYGDTNLLLTGDAGKKAFRHMEGTGQEVASEVLKAPHHGLKSGFNETFLKAANPEVVVISGRTHRRNQDMEERIARYAPFCKTVLSTSDCGAIVIETDGGEIRTKLTRNGRGNPL